MNLSGRIPWPEPSCKGSTLRILTTTVRLHRYQSSLTFPILDTFPPIFKETDDSGISVHAELGTSKAVAFWAQKLESQTKWLVGREDREDFCNGLHQIREAYVPDYDSLDEEWDD